MSRRQDGKIDRRTLEYRDAVARMAHARRAAGKTRNVTGARRRDGAIDQRTSAGRAMAAKMAALRAQRGKSKGFFSWLFG